MPVLLVKLSLYALKLFTSTVDEFLFIFSSVGILVDCKGSSVGVLVSGPKKMRHEIATICSSGLASNLHFEFISFSW